MRTAALAMLDAAEVIDAALSPERIVRASEATDPELPTMSDQRKSAFAFHPRRSRTHTLELAFCYLPHVAFSF
jgi:hypothetical protein